VCTVAESQHNFIVSLGEQLITIDALMCTISFVLKTLQDKDAQLVN
jgi:predicted transposase YbfD/YdcC